MRNLSKNELILTNGGCTCPTVSDDPDVQSGYSVGWHIGHAIGNTIEMMGAVLDTLNPFNWLD